MQVTQIPIVVSALQVALELGMHAMAVAIAGSLVSDTPNSAPAWIKLRKTICDKQKSLPGLPQAPDDGNAGEESPLLPVLELSFGTMGKDDQQLFLKLVVLAHDILVPLPMLANLWEKVCFDVWGFPMVALQG